MHRFILSIVLFCVTLAAAAVNGRMYSSELLANSRVISICQDRYGFIWIATDYGLSRFDGYHFTNCYHMRRDSTSLPHNSVGCFLADRSGNMWIGHGKGLCRYDYATEKFMRLPFPDGQEPRVYSMVQDNAGNIFIGTAGMGMYMMKDGKIVRRGEFSDGTGNYFVAHMHIDRHGNLWSGNHKNMAYMYRMKKGKMLSCKAFHSDKGEPMVFVDTDGRTMLVVCNKGILRYDYATGTLADAGYDLSVAGSGITIRHAFLAPSGNLYIGTYGHGLLVVRKGERKAVQETLSEDQLQRNAPYISNIMSDRNGNMWLACFETGIFQASQRKPAFHSWNVAAHDLHSAGRVTDLAPDADGGVWCAVRQGILTHVNSNGQPLRHIQTPPELCAVCRENDRHYWLGTGNTLLLLDVATGSIQKKHDFDGSGIGRIIYDGDGHLYISVYGKGFYRYDTATGTMQAFNASMDGPGGRLRNNWVGGMIIDSRRCLWLSTATGLSCMDTDGSFNHHGWNSLLDNLGCGPLCETIDHDIVIGTDDGLYIYRRATNRAERFPDSEQLCSTNISSIVTDRRGDLWIGTSNGLWQYLRSKRRFVCHLYGNGLTTREYISGAAATLSDGRIVFGNDRLTVFAPSDVKASRRTMGRVHLTRFLRDGTPVDFRSNRFVIPYHENTFSMEFSMLDYQSTDNTSLQYRINDGAWMTVARGSNVITFGKMKPGTYYIYVRAENNGAWSETTALTVVVLNPWYLSVWAIAAYLLLAVLAAWYAVRHYTRRKHRELDEDKMQFLINATHDIRSPLTLIMGPLEKLKNEKIEELKSVEEFQSFNSSILQPSIHTIHRNAQRLMLLVNQILDERRIDKKQMQLHCRETNLVELIAGICKLYQYNATQRNITFSFSHDTRHILAWVDRINFDKVVSNLLSNAFKYTYDGGEVKVLLREQLNDIVLQVIDNGVGLSREDRQRLFDRFYQGRNSDSLGMQGTGIGLNLSRGIVRLHGGQISADNRTDGQRGACFTVTIPKGNHHLKPEQIVTDQPTCDVLSQGGRQPFRQFRILIVDDDAEIANYITSELGDKYKFDHAPNGKEALKTLLTSALTPDQSYDLVISDVMMPEMDGITLLRRIKENPNISQLPVIMLTSKAEVEHKLEGLKSGADAYIAKPFRMDELHIQIDNLIAGVRRLRGKFSGALQQKERVEEINVKGNDEALMERVMRSVNANMSDPEFNVDVLASDVGLSRSQLHRKIKEITGVAAGRFLRNLRMEQAARLLREGKVNVSQVADSVGYIDQAHFSTAFKTHFGVSPTEYVISS